MWGPPPTLTNLVRVSLTWTFSIKVFGEIIFLFFLIFTQALVAETIFFFTQERSPLKWEESSHIHIQEYIRRMWGLTPDLPNKNPTPYQWGKERFFWVPYVDVALYMFDGFALKNSSALSTTPQL